MWRQPFVFEMSFFLFLLTVCRVWIKKKNVLHSWMLLYHVLFCKLMCYVTFYVNVLHYCTLFHIWCNHICRHSSFEIIADHLLIWGFFFNWKDSFCVRFQGTFVLPYVWGSSDNWAVLTYIHSEPDVSPGKRDTPKHYSLEQSWMLGISDSVYGVGWCELMQLCWSWIVKPAIPGTILGGKGNIESSVDWQFLQVSPARNKYKYYSLHSHAIADRTLLLPSSTHGTASKTIGFRTTQ